MEVDNIDEMSEKGSSGTARHLDAGREGMDEKDEGRNTFEHEVTDVRQFLSADLVVAGDGINSLTRQTFAEHFCPTLDWRKCKFTWLGTTKPLEAFTFIFRENEHGLFQVHAYPFQEGLSTFIVECREETWKRAGLENATEEETVTYIGELFADHLHGHPLLTNKSVWRHRNAGICRTSTTCPTIAH